MTPHINAVSGSIAPFVIISGDPLRVKNISLSLLTNPKLVSDVRNNYIYTGYYKGGKVSIASSGIGTSSIAIYVQELYEFYDVQVILRAGSCGSFSEEFKLLETVNVGKVHSDFIYYPHFYSDHLITPSAKLVAKIMAVSKELEIPIKTVKAVTETEFYPQTPSKTFAKQKIYGWQVVEMEAYALFVIAHYFNRDAACLLTISDQLHFTDAGGFVAKERISSQQRTEGFHSMFELALETFIKWQN